MDSAATSITFNIPHPSSPRCPPGERYSFDVTDATAIYFIDSSGERRSVGHHEEFYQMGSPGEKLRIEFGPIGVMVNLDVTFVHDEDFTVKVETWPNISMNGMALVTLKGTPPVIRNILIDEVFDLLGSDCKIFGQSGKNGHVAYMTNTAKGKPCLGVMSGGNYSLPDGTPIDLKVTFVKNQRV